MRAAIISIGDELLLGESLDTNTAWLAAELADRAIDVVEHRTLGDDQRAITKAMLDLAPHCDFLFTTGGLGPTADDLTRFALAEAVAPGKALVSDENAIEHLRNWFEHRGKVMPEQNRAQTLRPASAVLLPNPNGTAMGLRDTLQSCNIFALPGPPSEMKPMFADHVAPQLPAVCDDNAFITRFVHSYGIGESDAARRLGDLLARGRQPQIGITVSDATVTVRIRGRGERKEINKLIERDAAAVHQVLYPYSYGEGDQLLSHAIGALLEEQKAIVTTAESCTGGLLGKMLVDVSGSSSSYVGGWVTYSNQLKTQCLGVPAELIETKGAVSAEVAAAMARGARTEAGCAYAMSITGVAGPDGGTAEKPVGTVFIAVAEKKAGDEAVRVFIKRFQFPGNRAMIRERSAKSALQMLRFVLLKLDPLPMLLWETIDG